MSAVSLPVAGHHPAWLPPEAFAPIGRRHWLLNIPSDNAGTPWSYMDAEVAQTIARLLDNTAQQNEMSGTTGDVDPQIVFQVLPGSDDNAEAFTIVRKSSATGAPTGSTEVTAATPRGLLYGLFELVRQGEQGFSSPPRTQRYAPQTPYRMVDQWDNIKKHEQMGQVERGYSGGSIFYEDGVVRADLSSVERYAELLASVGINRVSINNVNVGPLETTLLTNLLPEVTRIAGIFRKWGITTFIAVSWAAPKRLGGLAETDPFNPAVQGWWRQATAKVWAEIPDFGGFVIKADSEGQPGPFAYGRTHADGANMLARAVAPFGGEIYWRAFVYNHTQDWRDRTTDRAKAAYQHFVPYDGTFEPNVIVQIKHGPLDFQVREATSPALAAMPKTRTAAEFQITTEYLGQQKHAVYLGRNWSQLMNFQYFDDGTTMADLVAGKGPNRDGSHVGGFAAVSNVGDDYFFTGHPFSQANLYAWGRLTWNPKLDPIAILDEWIGLTFPGITAEGRAALHQILDESWETYEMYSAPLGVGFMVYPHHHYGPSPDGYEYTPWGTYHFADRDGVGVDRTQATGSGYTGQYPPPLAETYESLDTVPDELLLFFHHVPYTHPLKSGKTVIQHIYDTHFDGLDRVHNSVNTWDKVKGQFPADVADRVDERFAEQVRSATDWRDIINTYFYRHSGIPDAKQRQIYA